MAIAGRSYPNVPVIIRGTLQDPPVLTTAPPVVVAAAYDRRIGAAGQPIVMGAPQAPVPATAPVVIAAQPDPRWRTQAPLVVLSAPQAQAAAPAAASPLPVVVAAQPPVRTATQAIVLRSTLADPAVLTTAGPLVVAAPYDRRWFAPGVLLTAAGSPLAAGPPVAQQGTATVSNTLAATVAISNVLAATVTISNLLAGSVTIVNDL